MSDKKNEIFLTVHGHFYQPPRENPWLEAIELQDSALPFHDWNERINKECYNPNSVSKIVDSRNRILDVVNNYEHMSFNFGPTLLSWMEHFAPLTYERIIKADIESIAEHNGHGNAIAQVYNHIIMPLAREKQVKILPVDSEHSAIFQSLQGGQRKSLHKILLTASGGPFRGKKKEELENIQVEDALKHPNWEMGKKITIDSSTMVNKGLEVIEAKWLFGVTADQIQVVVQPQSIIHSMVEYEDGAVIAQLGTPDMKLPIQYALYYPERRYLPGDRLDFGALSEITFERPDMETFYGLKLAYEAGRRGGSLPTVFNAANERAVAMFLDRKIRYLQIPEIIQACMEQHRNISEPTVEEILKTEQETYEFIKSRW